MKKIWVALVCSVLCMSLFAMGCSSSDSSNEEEEEEYFADEDFVKDMAKGLEARWKLNAEDEAKDDYALISMDSQEYQDMMIKYIDAELEYDEKYTGEKFEDSNLQELAVRYVNLLNEDKEACDYNTVDFEKYNEEHEKVFNERSKIISTMVSDYGLTVDEKYEDNLKDMITNSTLVEETEGKEGEVEELANGLEFEIVEDESDEYWKIYRATVENTTSIDFENFGIQINLLDEDGVIVDSQYAFVDNFNQGAKAQLEFGTDKDFASYEVAVDYWN